MIALRLLVVSGLLLGAATAASAQAPRARGGDPCATVWSSDAVAEVSGAGEVALASGRTARLAGVRLPEEGDPARTAALDLLRAAAGRPVAVEVGAAADRWGRWPAHLAFADREARLDFAQRLVEAGLALVDAGEADMLCRPDLLALEETARERRLGIWADLDRRPIPARDGERLRAAAGRFVLVEGRVRSVGERERRAYLNFGGDFGRDFALTLPKRTWSALAARGLTAETLRGRRVRARGVVEIWRGPVMELAAPDVLEVLEPRPR